MMDMEESVDMRRKMKVRIVPCSAVILTVLAVASLIPILSAARYTHPLMDDFDYGSTTYHVWLETHSIIQVLKTDFQLVKNTWLNWQGSYSGVFVMGLMPAIFGEQYYPITTVLNIFMLLIGNAVFCSTFSRYILKKDKWYGWLLTVLLTTLELNFMPDPVQGIYWFNGGLYYTGFYGLFMIYCSYLVKSLFTDGKHNLVVPVILLFLIMGSNLSIILTTVLITLTLTSCSFAKKKSEKEFLILLVITVLTFVLNVGAPGYRIRQSETPSGMGVFMTIAESIFYTLTVLEEYTSLYNLIAFSIIFLILVYAKKTFLLHVRKPVLTTVLLLGIYAAQFAPGYYSTGTAGPGRLLNISYYNYYWLVIGLMMVWISWLDDKNWVQTDAATIREWISSHFAVTALWISIAFTLSVLGLQMPTVADPGQALCLRTAAVLRDGRAQTYSESRNENLKQLLDGTGEDVILPALKAEPDAITMPGYFVAPDPDAWSNEQVAKYYRLRSVASE